MLQGDVSEGCSEGWWKLDVGFSKLGAGDWTLEVRCWIDFLTKINDCTNAVVNPRRQVQMYQRFRRFPHAKCEVMTEFWDSLTQVWMYDGDRWFPLVPLGDRIRMRTRTRARRPKQIRTRMRIWSRTRIHTSVQSRIETLIQYRSDSNANPLLGFALVYLCLF